MKHQVLFSLDMNKKYLSMTYVAIVIGASGLNLKYI